MGIYDQLENLNQPSPSQTAPVASPTTSKTVVQAESGQSPISENSNVKKRPTTPRTSTVRPTSKSTSNITPMRDKSREIPREDQPRFPSREEIQEFSFHMRDELKVKVQAEVPHYWQDELEEIARQLDVKKLELYRFILGEFLGKVRRRKAP